MASLGGDWARTQHRPSQALRQVTSGFDLAVSGGASPGASKAFLGIHTASSAGAIL